jgi:hypothetical protein
MDAQWMLKGCSMVAYPNQSTLKTLCDPENPNSLTTLEELWCKDNTFFSLFQIFRQKKLIFLHFLVYIKKKQYLCGQNGAKALNC